MSTLSPTSCLIIIFFPHLPLTHQIQLLFWTLALLLLRPSPALMSGAISHLQAPSKTPHFVARSSLCVFSILTVLYLPHSAVKILWNQDGCSSVELWGHPVHTSCIHSMEETARGTGLKHWWLITAPSCEESLNTNHKHSGGKKNSKL